jgi:hypothetical protein
MILSSMKSRRIPDSVKISARFAAVGLVSRWILNKRFVLVVVSVGGVIALFSYPPFVPQKVYRTAAAVMFLARSGQNWQHAASFGWKMQIQLPE